jgi:hypothetical protein
MHLPINVKSPNNISKWQVEFNSAFKELKVFQFLVMFFDHHTQFNAPIIFRACTLIHHQHTIHKDHKMNGNTCKCTLIPSKNTKTMRLGYHGVLLRNQVTWAVTPCCWVIWTRRFKETQRLVNNQLDAQLLFMYVHFYSLHVSSNHVPIIRRINCINKTSGICHSV